MHCCITISSFSSSYQLSVAVMLNEVQLKILLIKTAVPYHDSCPVKWQYLLKHWTTCQSAKTGEKNLSILWIIIDELGIGTNSKLI